MTPESYSAWHLELQRSGPRMSDLEMEACARLATVLLCGEQSAIQIFSAEVERGRAPVDALNTLRSIEYDEKLHEKALSALCEFLPRPDDTHGLKRRAQRFFAGLARVDDVARHFGQIASLDSAVCKIMWHVERSTIDRLSPLRHIATQIKNDEARHVTVSRDYAVALGLPRHEQQADSRSIGDGLIQMLEPLTASFETVGVDCDRLFASIRRPSLP